MSPQCDKPSSGILERCEQPSSSLLPVKTRWHARSPSSKPPTKKSFRKSQRLRRSAPPRRASPRRQRHRVRRPPYHRTYRLTHKQCSRSRAIQKSLQNGGPKTVMDQWRILRCGLMQQTIVSGIFIISVPLIRLIHMRSNRISHKGDAASARGSRS
jgi:hypothetical protein